MARRYPKWHAFYPFGRDRIAFLATSIGTSSRRKPLGVQRLEDRIAPAVIHWDGGASTLNWSDAQNWSADALPGSVDDVVIGSAFSGISVSSFEPVAIQSLQSKAEVRLKASTFSLATDSNVARFTVAGGELSGNGNLTITQGFNWTTGNLRGAGSLKLASTAVGTISGNSSLKYLGRTLENSGSLTYSGQQFWFGSPQGETGQIRNLSGAVFTLTGESDAASLTTNPANRIENLGVLVHSGAGESVLNGVRIEQSGTFQIQQGKVRFAGGGTFSNASIIAEGAECLLVDGVFTTAAGTTFSGTGPLSVGGVATLNVGGFTNLPILSVTSGTLTGAGIISVISSFNWTGGTIGGTGLLQIESCGLGKISGNSEKKLGRVIENAGTLSYDGAGLRLGTPTGESGVIRNLVNATFNFFGNSDIVAAPGADHKIENFGRFIHPDGGVGNLGTGVRLLNSGSIEVPNGDLVINDVDSSILLQDPNRLVIDARSSFSVRSSIGGTTQNADLFDPSGTISIKGGSASIPLTFEAMGRNLGPAASAFARNFRFGFLQLQSNSFVKLVDNYDNAIGAEPESLYVDQLLVPTGSTLDLNQLKVYARSALIEGQIVNGSITVIADGGAITVGGQIPGSISALGETDTWSFFGRANQSVSVVVQPGSKLPPPLPPVLDRAKVQLLDAANNVLATDSSTAPGLPATLQTVQLPTDGVYRIRITADPAGTTNTGNYLVGLFNASVDYAPLVVNQVTTGTLQTQYSLNRWTFTAEANRQVRLDVRNAQSPDIRYKLIGPGGFVGFNGQKVDSDLVTLPATGEYTLEVSSIGSGRGTYNFSLDQTNETMLTNAVPFIGKLTSSGQAELFRIDVPSGNLLNILLNDATDTNRNELYVRLGSPPTRRDFDYSYQSANSADHEIMVPFAAPGKWYILVYGDRVPAPSNVTVLARSAPVLLTNNSPNQGVADPNTKITVTGAGFAVGSKVDLVNGVTVIPANDVSIDSFTRVTATFDLSTSAAANYDLRVTLPGGATQTLPSAFALIPNGQGKLETKLILPDALGYHGVGTIYIEYANVGVAPLTSPILTLESNDPEGNEFPFLTLDQRRLTDGFWTSAKPEGFDYSVQVYAQGATPGLILPGERLRVPVYYAGMQTPWDFNDRVFEFAIRVTSAASTEPIDWPQVGLELRPDWISTEAWPAVQANLQAQIGTNWGQYLRMLSDNAQYLSRLGQNVTDISDLFGFEFQQAVGFSPYGSPEQVVDASVPAPGFSLSFDRVFAESMPDRFTVGPFGRGWSSSWHTRAETRADGLVTIHTSNGGQRRFQPDSRSSTRYLSAPGDSGTLRRLVSGGYELLESSGLATRYLANGRLNYVQDTNGNRITAAFTGNLLTGLTHSSGAGLTIAYNTAGRITSITDSVGRVVNYTYDASNQHLLSVTGPGGTTTYTYSIGQGLAREHALRTVTDPSGVVRTFEYDLQGRMSTTFLAINANRMSFSYSPTGRISMTDGSMTPVHLFYDHAGRIARVEDGAGGFTLTEYGPDNRPAKRTDALGRSQSYTWCGCGSMTSITNELGYTTTFDYGGDIRRMQRFTDARGNGVRYTYDSRGNQTAAIYADGTFEQATYDAAGNVTSTTNRRGQTITYLYNSYGKVTRENYPDGTFAIFNYDARQRLISTVDSSGTTIYDYDAADRLTKVTYPNNRWLEYLYDAAGRRTRMTDHEGFQTRYSYDAAGRLAELRDAINALIITYTYDAAGRLSREDKGNGTYSIYTYDAAGRVATITHYAPDGTVNSRFEYSYDILGRRTSAATPDGTWTYGYDATGQLTDADLDSTNMAIPDQDLEYAYDSVGNRLWTRDGAAVQTYTTNNLNQYTHITGIGDLVYDADGNLVNEGGGAKHFVFDYRNRLTLMTYGTSVQAFEYDVFSVRKAASNGGTRKEFLLDPRRLVEAVAEFDGSGNRVKSYIYGVGLESHIQTGTREYYDCDVVGSTVSITQHSGMVLGRLNYSPFGGLLLDEIQSQSLYKFNGLYGVRDEGNGILSMGRRFYSSRFGSFLSNDPLSLLGGDSNIRRFARNQPTDEIDPSGLGFFAKRPVNVLGCNIPEFIGQNPLDDNWNTEAAHEHYFFDDGTDVGFGPGGTYSGESYSNGYGQPSETYDDERIREALRNIPNENGTYDVLFNNCQDWAERLRDKYDKTPPKPPHPPQCRLCDDDDDGSTDAVEAVDPNEKETAAGFGPQRFITANTVIPYTIRFENLGPGSVPEPTQPATAPAQRVLVTDQISTNHDWSSFRFIEFGFGDTVVTIPEDRQYFFDSLFVTIDDKTLQVEVELDFDSINGMARVIFYSVDPATGLPPDVFTGFLPPEDGTGRGMGHVGYTIQPKSTLTTGTVLSNIALIQFDGGLTIATNQIEPLNPAAGTDPEREARNTIDAGAPTSSVVALPALSTTNTGFFTVNWAGTDDVGGSGIATYDIYVSVNGAAFEPWLLRETNTSALYPAINGATYSFFSVATDNVGHRQPTPTGGQATTVAKVLPTQVLSVVVNDGSVQRSRVTSLTTTFSQYVNFSGPAASAFTLTRLGGSAAVIAINAVVSTVNNQTVVVLTFSGPGTEAGSLADGEYALAIDSTKISNPIGFLDGDANGLAGGTYVTRVHRLFGDSDGDRDVDTGDFIALRLAFGGSSATFDIDGDSDVDAADLVGFRLRFGTAMPTLPPRVAGVVVNNGAPQRSRVTSITVSFDQAVVLPANAALAFQLRRLSDNAIVALNAAVTSGPTTAVTLTFTGGPLEFGSLADGRYELTVFATQVAGGSLDGNGDGTSGDNFVLTSTGSAGIHRLFGDSDGDADVDSQDFTAFRLAFGSSNPAFDGDGDGDVDAADFTIFRLRFGNMLP
ncbi:MAG: hypothetical protein K1X57_17610 [Gemmataceae bacterium]|nr:hypothetical protein [Gemmataceae bacterium]